MAKLLKLRRGTTSQHSSFTGAEGEVTVDTNKDTLVVHDGSTAGGHELLREDMSNLPAGTIDNADVNASAAIAGTKISPNFGSQTITTTGQCNTGDISITGTAPSIVLQDSNDENDFAVANNGGLFKVRDVDAGVDRFTITSAGVTGVSGNLDVGAGVDVTGNVAATGNVTAVNITASNDITAKDIVISDTTPALVFTDTDNNPDFKIMANSGALQFVDTTNSNANRIVINSDGHVDVAGNLDVGAGVDVTGNLGVTGTSTFNNHITLSSAHNRVIFTDTNNDPDYMVDSNGGHFLVYDSTNGVDKIKIQSDGHIDIHGNVDFTSGGIDVTGDITVSGTVDGADVAAMNTKLSGIESGATADQTGAQIASALSGEDISGLGNIGINAQLSARKGVFSDDGSASPTVQISTDDGSPWALQIKNDTYWNSTNNGFKAYQDNSGNFRFNWEGNGAFINTYFQQTNGGTTNNTIHFDTNRACHLAWQGATRLSTESAGIAVNGQVKTIGHVYPNANNTYDLGTNTNRWRNVYTNDLHLSNEGHSNDVDGTWGNWTIQEGESELFLKNNRSGKKYKFNLTEVS